MGIGEAIARVKQGVRLRTSELGEQLHSDAIPPRLRPAAVRLAALLRVEPADFGSRAQRRASTESASEAVPALDDVLAAPSAITMPTIDPAEVARHLPEAPVAEPLEVPAPVEPEQLALPGTPPEDPKRAARRAAIARAATKAEKPRPAPSAPSDSATRAKPTAPKPASAKKESAKRPGGVAAKPGSANSSARRDAKPASKRTTGKAPRKK